MLQKFDPVVNGIMSRSLRKYSDIAFFYRFRCADESVSMITGRLFLDNLNYFELYALYAKNKPKSDQLMREAGHKFFNSVQVK